MYGYSGPPTAPRNGKTLVVGIVARISGCANQKELSLDDQVDHGKQVVAEMYNGPVDYRIIATKGKGERLDRPELEEIEAALRTRELDLLVMEDLGRLIRGAEASHILGIAVDHGTRVIVPNDCIDTAEATWEEDALAACRDHVGHNAHTSKRLKHKLMNRFLKLGGAPARPVAGYIVPPGVKNYGGWCKDAKATPVIAEGLRVLRNTQSYSAVADFFNTVKYDGGTGFPSGPYCRRRLHDGSVRKTPKWDGRMVRRFFNNRILGGAPGRGFKHTVKHHETGRRIAVPNPKGPQFIECPHLAHVDLDELDAVGALLKQKNASMGRKKVNGVDPLFLVSRKDSRFPAPNSTCWYCGRHHVWGGNGMIHHLMCAGTRDWTCWCGVGFDGPLAVTRVMGAITAELYRLEEFDEQFRRLVQQAQGNRGDLEQRWRQLHVKEEALAQKQSNAKEAMAKFGAKPLVQQLMSEVDIEEATLGVERRELEAFAKRRIDVPASVAQLRSILEEQFVKVAEDSREFNNFLRRLVPAFHVYLVRLCDGGHLLPRARITLSLDGIVADAQHVPGLTPLLRRELTINLFDPPQRETIREEAVALEARDWDQREIAKRLAVTQAAVHKALALDRRMRSMGLTSPYVFVTDPPADYTKLRRHKNGRYCFEPADGYERPPV